MVLTNEWLCTNEIVGKHKGAIWRIAWGDPEFGSIIASCGYDQFVQVYKEKETFDKNAGVKKNILSTGRTWNCEIRLSIDAPIRDIKFAPRFFGLVLAVACGNGDIKIFQPNGDDLNDWGENFGKINTFRPGCNCVAWNPALDEDVMILAGCEEKSSSRKQNIKNEEVDQ